MSPGSGQSRGSRWVLPSRPVGGSNWGMLPSCLARSPNRLVVDPISSAMTRSDLPGEVAFKHLSQRYPFCALRDECANAGVAFFMKQMTGKKPIPDDLLVHQFPDRS